MLNHVMVGSNDIERSKKAVSRDTQVVVARLDQTRYETPADISGRAGDENPHVYAPLKARGIMWPGCTRCGERPFIDIAHSIP